MIDPNYVRYVANGLEVLIDDISKDGNGSDELVRLGDQTVELLREYAQGGKP